MKSHMIFFAFIFYAFLAHSEAAHNRPEPQIDKNSHPRVVITVNNNPHSNCQSENAIDQDAQHASKFATETQTAIQQKTNQRTHGGRITLVDAVNLYVTLICWPAGALMYWARTNSDQE